MKKALFLMLAMAACVAVVQASQDIVDVSSTLQKKAMDAEAKRAPKLGKIWKTHCIGAASIGGVTNCVYTGSAITPLPVVTLGGVTLTKDTDYTVAYSNNTQVGTAYVTVTAKKVNLVGSQRVRFKITSAD